MTLRSRMGAVAGVAVAVAVIAVAATVYLAVQSQLRGEIDRTLNDRAQPFIARQGARDRRGADGHDRRERGHPARPGIHDPGGGQGAAAAASKAPFGGPSGVVQFVHPDGRVFRPPDEHFSLPVNARVRAMARSGRGRYLTDLHPGHVHVRVLAIGRGPRGVVEVARPLTEVDQILDDLLLVLLIVGVAGIIGAVVLGALVARTALAPIARFTKRTETLAGHPDLSQRLEVEGKDELARLARSFNLTLDALDQSVQAQRHLIADASHELRTPIATLRANIQVLEDADRLPASERNDLRADIIQELDELTALVGDVVELARGARPAAALDEVRVDEIVAAQVDRARRRASDVDFQVRLEPTVVRGDPDRINRAVSNLLDNARKWSPPGGVVEVDLVDARLSIRDHGRGFEEKDLPHVFDRFYRAEGARRMPGSGLGLAIVRQAAETHGGSTKAQNAPGGGALLHVSFGPALASPETSATPPVQAPSN